MKAVLLTGHGGPEKLVYGDTPDPVAGPGEVVVDVHAASVNAATADRGERDGREGGASRSAAVGGTPSIELRGAGWIACLRLSSACTPRADRS